MASNNQASTALAAPMILKGTQIEAQKILYGTAWKKERTAELTYQALKAGFKGFDTAAQPRQ